MPRRSNFEVFVEGGKAYGGALTLSTIAQLAMVAQKKSQHDQLLRDPDLKQNGPGISNDSTGY
jgi:hypothetical protein